MKQTFTIEYWEAPVPGQTGARQFALRMKDEDGKKIIDTSCRLAASEPVTIRQALRHTLKQKVE